MTNLNEFYKNIKSYSRLGIKKYIIANTENLKPSLLIELNSEFVDLYLEEIKAENKKKLNQEFDEIIENLFDKDGCKSSFPEGTDHITERRYEMVNVIIEVKEKAFKGEYLSYRDYNRINYKICDFQSCMQEIIEEINRNIENNDSEDFLVDLSDTSASEKIIYLEKLGVLDFLRNKQHVSTNGLASALSAITGEKIQTLQPMLNPIVNKQAGQKNNPLESTTTVQKVKKHLNNLGFTLNETI
ncbi:hypothetical protein IWX84_001672 [Flavobacterium sp. CG_9.10]|uniref:hypothetical protein n=1 Tax=Flavobacterium sp. CG_9.10 TaxID=2787729 RepID=UPI0018CB8A5E|nr:hypothetical protein [Flavobacterium sp. CG_9.10]MBG6110792.1 hypothetical protein [Flavobacterium sp. CG_9.10]